MFFFLTADDFEWKENTLDAEDCPSGIVLHQLKGTWTLALLSGKLEKKCRRVDISEVQFEIFLQVISKQEQLNKLRTVNIFSSDP